MEIFKKRLDSIKRLGLYRKIREFEGCLKTRICNSGKEIILFSSNDYLGLSGHPALKTAAINALERYGCGTGASRLISGTLKIHEILEKEVAVFKKKEAALVFSSGFAANLGIISTLTKKGDFIFCDKLNHASIIQGALLSGATIKRYPHRDMNALDRLLKTNVRSGIRLIITDTIFSMDGDIAPLCDIVDMAKRYDALLMVDDAHGTGVFGECGGGIPEYLGLENEIDIHMGTFSKALGSIGGFFAGSAEIKKFLINKAASFIYTTSLPAPVTAASLAAVKMVKSLHVSRKQLHKNSTRLRRGLKEAGFDTMYSRSPIIPVLMGDNKCAMNASSMLIEEGFFVPAIREPTVPRGTSRLRISVSSDHTSDDIDRIIKALIDIGRRLGVI